MSGTRGRVPHQATFALLCSRYAGAEVGRLLRVSRGAEAVSLPTSLCAVGGLEEVDRSWRARQLMLCQKELPGQPELRWRRTVGDGHWDRSYRLLTRVSVAAGWGQCYAAYRGYYAAGGTAFRPGTICRGSEGQSQLINLAAVVVLAVAAALPVAMLPLWARRGSRLVLLALRWVVAAGCWMHALIDMGQRALSRAGLVHIHYPPLWATVNDWAADCKTDQQRAMVPAGRTGLRRARLDPPRPRPAAVAVGGQRPAATCALTLVGLLSVTGVIGKVIVA